MNKTFDVTFTVRGRGEFPMDMLRFDNCTPATPDDLKKVQWKHGDDRPEGVGVLYRREVKLVAKMRHKYARPTNGRRESFGWKVAEVEDNWKPN